MPHYIECVGPDGQTAHMTERQLERVYAELGWRPAKETPEPEEPEGSDDTDDDVVEGA